MLILLLVSSFFYKYNINNINDFHSFYLLLPEVFISKSLISLFFKIYNL